MDAERIAEIRARVEAATPGPWKDVWPCNCEEISISRDGAHRHEELHMTPPDTDFIAHSRQDIPDLLAEVARLTAEREEYERTRWTVVAQRNGALNDLETANAELSRLRAVIEEARKALSLNGSFYTPRAVVISMLKL